MMDSAFGWLSSLIEWVGQFFPRWTVVAPTHGWIKFVRGHRIVTGGAQIVWWWPATTKFEEYPVARQAVDLRTQTMTTSDNKVIAIGGLVVYEISDLEKILAHTFDPEQTIKDIAMGAIHDVCSAKTWNELKSKGFDRDLRREVAKRLLPYGVRVIRTTLSDLAPARVIKLMQTMAQEGL